MLQQKGHGDGYKMKGSTILEGIKIVVSDPKKFAAKRTEIGVGEAHSIWSLLANRYLIREQLNYIKNFVHDRDFLFIVKRHIGLLDNQINHLEKLADYFSIMPPEPNIKDMNATGSTEAVSDKRSAQLVLSLIKIDIISLSRALMDSRINDEINQLFTDLLVKSFEVFDSFFKFLKLKNWLDKSPLYKYASPSAGEITAAEVYLIWEHLVSRYQNLRETQIFIQHADDKDLKAILELGLNILTRQATTLEDKLLEYGVALPEHYTQIAPTPETTEFREDKFIFNIILQGIVQTTILHINAIQEINSDKLRNFFINLTREEISLLGKFRKFGKLKGWTHMPPKYAIGQT